MRPLLSLLLLLALLVPNLVAALGLGDLEQTSVLNEPYNARIE